MEIKSIKVDNVDNNVRAITIKTSEENIKTPNRCIVTSDINKIKGMRNQLEEPASPFDVAEETFPWQIYQASLEYDAKVRGTIARQEDGLNKKISSIKSTKVNSLKNMLEEDNYKNILKIMYPKTKLDDPIAPKFMTALMELQCKVGLDVITIPEPVAKCSFEDFVDNIKLATKFLDDIGCELPVMPLIDIKSNNERFEKKLDYLIDQSLNTKKDFKLVGIPCRVYGHNINLHSLRDYSDKLEKFWVHGLGAYRFKPRSQVYNPHAATIWGIDTVALSPQGKHIPGVTDQNNNEDDEVRLRLYNPNSWGIYKRPQNTIEDNLCDCDGCSYYRNTHEQTALDVHEVIQSHSQIVGSREYIQEDDYLSLVQEKSDFRDYYEDTVRDL